MAKHEGDDDGEMRPEPEPKSRKEDMMGKVEELRGGEGKVESGQGVVLEAGQPKGEDEDGERSKDDETPQPDSKAEEPREDESKDTEPQVEELTSSGPTNNESDDGNDEPKTDLNDQKGDPKSNAALDDLVSPISPQDGRPPTTEQSDPASDTDVSPETEHATPGSQQSTLADPEAYRRLLEHSAPEVVEGSPTREKEKGDLCPSPQHAYAETTDDTSPHYEQHRHNGLFWSPPSPLLEHVPPRYPGGPSNYPEVVDAPLEMEASLARPQDELICGLRKRQFLLMFGIAALVVVVVAVSVGIGVAYGTRKTVSAPKSTALTPWPLKPCDAIHNTKFTADNGKVFQRLCFIDYGGSRAEATDVLSLRTPTMEDCIKACSKEAECTGAGWGPANGVNTYRTTCWMKKDLKKPHVATPDFEFAVLVSGNVTIPDMEPYF